MRFGIMQALTTLPEDPGVGLSVSDTRHPFTDSARELFKRASRTSSPPPHRNARWFVAGSHTTLIPASMGGFSPVPKHQARYKWVRCIGCNYRVRRGILLCCSSVASVNPVPGSVTFVVRTSPARGTIAGPRQNSSRCARTATRSIYTHTRSSQTRGRFTFPSKMRFWSTSTEYVLRSIKL